MRELSMHILDLAQNSIAAGATEVRISVDADTASDLLRIAMHDNGKGMTEEQLASVRDPFYTTRTTRRVGLGIPMLTEAARACGGDMVINSAPGKGTVWTAVFQLSHIDRAPLGDIASTLVALIAANPEIRFRYSQSVDGAEFTLDTDEIKAQLDGVPINDGAVLKWIGEYVRENAATI
jgi:signal transduction histidine kinase